jgi:hypothetical protein
MIKARTRWERSAVAVAVAVVVVVADVHPATATATFTTTTLCGSRRITGKKPVLGQRELT